MVYHPSAGRESSFLSHPYCQAVDLLATPYTAKLAIEVFPWIGAVVFAVVLGLFVEPLRDDVAHTRVDIYVEDLKSVSHGYASESKEAALRVRRSFSPRPKAKSC